MNKTGLFKTSLILSGLVMHTLAFASSYSEGVLSNGMKYKIFSTDIEKNYLDIHLLVNAGGADERSNEYGSAHMLEHTLFHSSKHFPTGISTELIDQGWKMGEQLNAYTGFEQTKFVMTPPRGTKDFDTALLAMQDIVANPGLTEKDWKMEQEIVLAEWRNNQGMLGRLKEQRRQIFKRGSRQVQSTLIGTEQDIVTRESSVLRSFHDRWYQPSNIQVALIGDLSNTKMVVNKLEKYLGSIENKAVPARDKNYYDPILEPKWHVANVKDQQSKNNQVSLIFRTTNKFGRDYQTEAGIRSQLIDRSARTMIMERLDALNTTLPKGIDSIFVQRSEVGHHTVSVSIFAGTRSGKQYLGLASLFKFRQQLLNYPITEKELKFYRDDMDAYIKANIDDTDLAEDIASLRRLALGAMRNRPVQSLSKKLTLYKKLMASISPKDVNERIQHWFNAKDRTAMFQTEAGAKLKTVTVKKLNELEEVYKNKEIAAPIDIEDIKGGKFEVVVKPGKVVSKETVSQNHEIRKWALSNGDTFIWLKSDVAKDDAYFRAVSKVGYLAKDMEGWKSRLASQFVWMSAPKGYSLQSLGTWRRRNSIILRNLLAGHVFQINAESGVENIDKIFEGYAAYQLTPKIDDDFMSMQVDGVRASLKNQDETSKKIQSAQESLRYRVSHLTTPKSEKLDSLTKEELLGLWGKIAKTPVTYYLVANVPEATVESLVNRFLSGIPRESKNRSFYQEKLATGNDTVKLGVGISPRTDIDSWKWVNHAWSINVMQQLRLSVRLIKIALKEEMREKEKGVYTVEFDSNISLKNAELVSHLHFNAKPKKAQKLWEISQDTLANLSDNLTQLKLNAEKKHLLKTEKRALKRPMTWLNRLEASYEHYGDARVLTEMNDIDEKLNLADIKEMINKLWSGDNQKTLWVTPKKKN